MKKLLLLFACLTAALGVYAHDIIVKKDGSTIESKVERITSTEVEYKKATNLNGPTYTIPISDLLAINYDNGEKETFGSSPASQSTYSYNPTAVTQESASMFSNDNDLRRLNASFQNPYSKKARNWRIAGWYVGGALTVGGIVCFIVCMWNADGFRYNNGYSPVVGVVMTGVGIGFGTTALILGNNYAKKAKAWAESYSLINKGLQFNDGSRLNLGLDMITYNEGLSSGRRINSAIGVGLNYSF